MIEEERIFQIEVMPKIKGFWCLFTVYAIYLTIVLAPFLIAIFSWQYSHSIWIGFLFFLFCMLISGVVVSKLRVGSIPFVQREMNYSTIAIVMMYVGKNICIEKLEE
ncbi:MAG: hypothetical protein JJV95_03790 [Sulfurospirillum sp.]|nr:hypothetical protein [Sulfurospirillum sp.]MBL0703084.1 hypothetical protein [Sulfurospirillum sp.]